MKGFNVNIEKGAVEIGYFCKVLYLIYSPAHHRDRITRMIEKDTSENPEEFDGIITE